VLGTTLVGVVTLRGFKIRVKVGLLNLFFPRKFCVNFLCSKKALKTFFVAKIQFISFDLETFGSKYFLLNYLDLRREQSRCRWRHECHPLKMETRKGIQLLLACACHIAASQKFSGFILDNGKICKIEAIFSYFHKKRD
jgi:hypothetical protein